MGRHDGQPISPVIGVIITIVTTLLGVVTITSTASSSPQPAVIGRIAYVPRAGYKASGDYSKPTDLVYMKLPSLESVKISVSNPLLGFDIGQFQWSPDASRLLFVTKIKHQSALSVPWIIDLRTKQLEPVTKLCKKHSHVNAAWLQDGRIVSWVVTGINPEVMWGDTDTWSRKGGESHLVVIDSRSGQEKIIWRTKYLLRYECSPARNEILVYDGDYYLISAEGKLKWKIKGSDTPDSMAFSPDGRMIALYVEDKLYVIDCRTKAKKLIYTNQSGGPPRSLKWSPDSKWIAFRDSRNEAASYDPPVVDFGWAVTAVNVETKTVHEFPAEVYRQGKYDYTPEVLGWTKDSKNLVLSVPEHTGRPYPDVVRDQLILCPLAGGKGIWVADITSYAAAVDWLPK